MSGRLTILPKKTYCPWKPENVERVLRDERLERERLEKEAEATRAREQQRRRRRRGEDDEPTATADGHINLFPEAKEAEIRLATGRGKNDAKDAASAANGILPVPLGGDEATKRKTGAVPFYMRPDNYSEARKYDNTSGSFRLGSRRDAATADEVTNKIMNDQFERREDARKEGMDPMSRFVGTDSSKIRASQKANNNPHNGGASLLGLQMKNHDVNNGNGHKRDFPCEAARKTFKEKRCRTKYQKKRSHKPHKDETDRDSGESHVSSSSSGSSSSSSRKERRHYSSSRRRSKSPSSRKTSRRKRGKESKRRRRSRHRSLSSDGDNNESTGGNAHSEKRERSRHRNNELEELRKRRNARESRESERESRVLLPRAAKMGSRFADDGNRGGYQDQFHPSLSRN